jgi:pSer/pThr/pTyr-binding forkhead associated (FHA) protein
MEKDSSSDLPVLIGQTGILNGLRWLINGEVTIGRDADCDVVIADRQVSRYHARLTSTPRGLLLEDLGSKNGTYLNGKLVGEPVYLQDGDILAVALVQNFVFLSSDATMPMESGVPLGYEQRLGRLRLDARSRRVWIGQQEVLPPLSAPQFRLLQILYDQMGKVVPRQDLITAVWGEAEAVGISEQAMDALVRRLRDRLSQIDPKNPYIITVRGHGLRLENPED